MTTPEAREALTEALATVDPWAADPTFTEAVGRILAALHDAGYALTPLAPEVPARRDGLRIEVDVPIPPLRDDIAAMLHFRGRVLHPRVHPKTTGGPCEECMESANQATEFVVAAIRLAATRSPEPPDSGLRERIEGLVRHAGDCGHTECAVTLAREWLATPEPPDSDYLVFPEPRRSGPFPAHIVSSKRADPVTIDGAEPPDSGDGAALRDLEARIRALFINDNNFGGPSAETVKAHNIAIEQALAQFIPLIDLMQPRSGSPAPEGGE